MEDKRFDVVIVGAGVAGSAMAHALATIPRQKPWNIALIERSFSEPERLVGEVLQPGGVEAIRELGMESALDNSYAILLEGYLLVNGSDSISLPYKKGGEGRTFHHGKFVMGLRRVVLQNANVQPIEATATKLIECPFTGRVTGVAVTRQSTSTDDPKLNLEEAARLKVYGDLVIVADGAFSKFRQAVLQDAFYKPEIYSYLVGAVMRDTLPPIPGHPAVILAEGLAPIFLVQLSDTDTRIGVDVPVPLPEDLQGHLLDNVVPKLPESVRDAAREQFEKRRMRMAPNYDVPAIQQGTRLSKQGALLLGDSWNTRHPITGAGMTVALQDVLCLRKAIESSGISSFRDWDQMSKIVRQWHWGRKSHAAPLNVLGSVMYALMKRDDGVYGTLRSAYMKVLLSGEGSQLQECVDLFSGKPKSIKLLLQHLASISMASARALITKPHQLRKFEPNGKPQAAPSTPFDYARLFAEALVMAWTGLTLVVPILWSEVRWWAPGTTPAVF